jgi:pyrimidine-nucleoside phosphorylase
MTDEETAWLTDAMARSGERIDLSDVPGAKVGKHSTGGVGDKVSIVLAPLAAACGVVVPKMSGRGLGHTGGTLDKLESIPGFRTGLSLSELRAAMSTVGCALIGQTSEVAPADRKLYAIRDVTGTVESIPLICASIMSKKIAEGIGGLVLDVKTGVGAFMKTLDDSRALARSLVRIGHASGVRTEALITRMDAPLGRMVGNAMEVIESIDVLKGRGPADLEALSVLFAARMLVLAGVEPDEDAAVGRVRLALTSGAGVDALRRIIENQGGDPRVIDDYSRLPSAPDSLSIDAPQSGILTGLHAEAVGRAAVALGAGRATLDDAVDPGVGIEILVPVGERVSAGDPLLLVRHRGGRGLAEAVPLLNGAVGIGDIAPPPQDLVVERVTEDR